MNFSCVFSTVPFESAVYGQNRYRYIKCTAIAYCATLRKMYAAFGISVVKKMAPFCRASQCNCFSNRKFSSGKDQKHNRHCCEATKQLHKTFSVFTFSSTLACYCFDTNENTDKRSRMRICNKSLS